MSLPGGARGKSPSAPFAAEGVYPAHNGALEDIQSLPRSRKGARLGPAWALGRTAPAFLGAALALEMAARARLGAAVVREIAVRACLGTATVLEMAVRARRKHAPALEMAARAFPGADMATGWSTRPLPLGCPEHRAMRSV